MSGGIVSEVVQGTFLTRCAVTGDIARLTDGVCESCKAEGVGFDGDDDHRMTFAEGEADDYIQTFYGRQMAGHKYDANPPGHLRLVKQEDDIGRE